MKEGMQQVTLIFDPMTFGFVFNQCAKIGGDFKELLAERYCQEINEKYPDINECILKIHFKGGYSGKSLMILLFDESRGNPRPIYAHPGHNPRVVHKAERFCKDWIVGKKEIINPVEVGI